jgi:hypothetical protein
MTEKPAIIFGRMECFKRIPFISVQIIEKIIKSSPQINSQ